MGLLPVRDHPGGELLHFLRSIDHVHVDAAIVGTILTEFYMMYTTLVGGDGPIALPEAGSYDNFCRREHNRMSTLTLESPEVRAWTNFIKYNDGGLPAFPLPLGDASNASNSDTISVTVLVAQQTIRFESVCTAAGARFIGDVLACAALTEHKLPGAKTYCVLTPRDTRRTPADEMTRGWFTGLVPITVRVADSGFDDVAGAAQPSFDSGRGLSEVPYGRIRELAPTLSKPRQPGFPVVNFFDMGAAPLSILLTAEIDHLNVGLYIAEGGHSRDVA